MKFLLVLALAVVAVSARPSDSEIDWSGVVPIWQIKAQEEGTPIDVSRDRRIVNGEKAEPHQFPYQTATLIVTATGAGLCGGSVIRLVSFKINLTHFNNFFITVPEQPSLQLIAPLVQSLLTQSSLELTTD